MGHVPRARRAVAVALALLRTALSGHRGQRLRLQLVVARGVPGRGWPVRHAACSDLRDAASAPESRLPESGECNESKTAAMSNLVPATQWGFRSMILGGLARCSDGVDRAPMRPCSCSACDVAAISRRACTSAEASPQSCSYGVGLINACDPGQQWTSATMPPRHRRKCYASR